MKILRYLIYICLFTLCALPIIMQAQDTSDDDDIFVPLPTACLDAATNVVVSGCVTPSPTTPPKPTAQATSQPTIINGLWVMRPDQSSFSSTGSCQIQGGDNGGMGNGGTSEDLPTLPVCMTVDSQWLQVNSSDPYPEQIQGVYSQSEMSRELLNENGTTSGSVNITITRAYHVVSPTRIEFTYTRHEEGGCTTTSTIVYELVEANELVCSGVIITPNATPTLVSTLSPDGTSQPNVTSVPETPISTGSYFISLPPEDDICTAEAMPDFDAVDVQFTDNQDMVINYGMGSYTLFWDGDDYYTYEDGNRFSVSVSISNGSANFFWSKSVNPGDSPCFIYSPLVSEDAPVFPPTAIPTIEPTSAPSVDAASIAGNTYTATWDAPEYLCEADLVGSLPDLDSATLEAQADDTFLFTVAGSSYILTNNEGIYVFTEFNDDNSMTQVSMNGFYEGLGSGTYGLVMADGKICFAQLTFTPAS